MNKMGKRIMFSDLMFCLCCCGTCSPAPAVVSSAVDLIPLSVRIRTLKHRREAGIAWIGVELQACLYYL